MYKVLYLTSTFYGTGLVDSLVDPIVGVCTPTLTLTELCVHTFPPPTSPPHVALWCLPPNSAGTKLSPTACTPKLAT